MSEGDCYLRAIGEGVDPSGLPWAELEPGLLRARRSSIKWRRFPAEVLPMFVAEMDFAVAPEVRHAISGAVAASDIGYVEEIAPVAEAFAFFADNRWGWKVPTAGVRLTTDVATGVVESLRVGRPGGGRLVLSTPTYPGFFEMLEEVPFEVVELPLLDADAALVGSLDPAASVRRPARSAASATLDLEAIAREFERGADAFILCNPHNPHGVPFGRNELTALAHLAAEHDVFVVSDEIHAPLTHSNAVFTPFAPIAAEAGALSVTATSASKGWNLAGAKCSIIVAADERANRLLEALPPEVHTRTSLLGVHANIAAFTAGVDWLDRTVAQIEANQALFAELVAQRLPGVEYRPGTTGYLAWIDLRRSGLGEHPTVEILDRAKVALNDGRDFGAGGAGHARVNLACAPDTIVRGIDRIAALLASTATEGKTA